MTDYEQAWNVKGVPTACEVTAAVLSDASYDDLRVVREQMDSDGKDLADTDVLVAVGLLPE